jgi:hypothetical protein
MRALRRRRYPQPIPKVTNARTDTVTAPRSRFPGLDTYMRRTSLRRRCFANPSLPIVQPQDNVTVALRADLNAYRVQDRDTAVTMGNQIMDIRHI